MSEYGHRYLRVRSVRDFFWIARRHARKVASVLLVMAGLTAMAYLYLPIRYRSEAKLLVRVGRETMRLDPTVAIGPTMSVSQSRLNEINSEVEILKSQDLHFDLVEDMGAARVVPGTVATEDAVRKLRKKLRVEPGIDSDIISVEFTHDRAEEAQAILRRLLELHLDKHIKVHRTEGSLAFFEQQTEGLRDRITKQREALDEKRRALGVYSLESHRQALTERRALLLREQEMTASERAASRAKTAELQKALDLLKETIVVEQSQGNANAISEVLRSRIANLKLQRADLLSKGHLDDSPVVAATDEQIRIATELLEGEADARTIVRTALNPNRQRLELELLLEKSGLVAMAAKQEQRARQIEQVETELVALQEAEGEILALRNELTILESKRERYLDGLEQARMDEALSDDKISNISVVQKATLPTRPLGPPRLWIAVIGGALAMFLACVVVLLADYYDNAFLVPGDVQRSLATAVPAALPSVTGLQIPMSRPADPKGLTKLPLNVAHDLELLVGRVLTLGKTTPTIAVTGARRGVGASTVAFHLAARLAATGLGRALLVDADDSGGGLTDVLKTPANGNARPSEGSYLSTTTVHPTVIPNLDLLPRRDRPDVAGLLNDIERCKERGESFVVIDLPAVSQSASAVELAKRADCTLFVVDSERTDVRSAQRALENLVDAKTKILGTILNYHAGRNGGR